MNDMPEQSFAQACMHFFGKKSDQSLSDFMKEIKALSEKDKKEISEGLVKLGYRIRGE